MQIAAHSLQSTAFLCPQNKTPALGQGFGKAPILF
jgi:hypothetical protein